MVMTYRHKGIEIYIFYTDLNEILYTSNILSIPCILIRYLYAILLIMTNLNFKQQIIETMKVIEKRAKSLDELEEA